MKPRTFLPLFLFAVTLAVLFSPYDLFAQSAGKRLGKTGLEQMPAYNLYQVKGGREVDVQPKVTEDKDKCASLQPNDSLWGHVTSYQTGMSSTDQVENTTLWPKFQNRVTCLVTLSTNCGDGASAVVAPHSKHPENNLQAAVLCEALKSAFLAEKFVLIYYDNGHEWPKIDKDTFYIYAVSFSN